MTTPYPAPRARPVRHRSKFVLASDGVDLTLIFGGVSAAIVALAGRQFRLAPASVSYLAPAAVGLLIGLMLWFEVPNADDPRDHRWRRLLGIGAMVWSLGQTVLAIELHTSATRFPSYGDLISVLAVPLILTGCSLAVRSAAFDQPILRIGVDALLLGSSGCLLVWELDIAHGPGAATAVGILLPDLVIGAFALLMAVRRPQTGTILFSVGLGVMMLADVKATLAASLGQGPPLLAGFLYCVGLALFGVGIRRFGTESDEGADVRRDGRQAWISSLIAFATIGCVIVIEGLEPRAPDTAHTVLGGLVVTSLAARYALDHHQRSVMFGRLSRQAVTDPLTHLGNRVAVEQAQTTRRPWVVVMVGVDGMASFNERHGHEAGDALVVGVAHALDRAFPRRLALARIGVDEFALVVETEEPVLECAERAHGVVVRSLLRRRTSSQVKLGVATGVATGMADDRSALDTMARAQRARFAARQSPDGGVRAFDDELIRREERERKVEDRLAVALRDGLLEVHLQPVVELRGHRVVAVEALARWNDPELGVVHPAEFIERAEASGQIGLLGLAVMRAAAKAAVDLDLGRRGIRVSVNVSVAQLTLGGRGGSFADDVKSIIDEVGLSARNLVVEVTESMLLVEHDPAVVELQRLSAMGIRLAVDDFGSGHWALGYLRWLPTDIVKIDRSLIADIADSSRAQAVVESIVALCGRLGMTVVAEGIEDQDQADVAETLGVAFAQGWLFAAAVPAVELVEVIESIERIQPDPLGAIEPIDHPSGLHLVRSSNGGRSVAQPIAGE